MKRSTDHIRTTHTGSLPRPQEIFDLVRALTAGETTDEKAYEAALERHVGDFVRKQVEAGIDVVTDGELSKPSFQAYVGERLAGFEARIPPGGLPVPTGPMGVGGRDAEMFPDFYRQVLENNPFKHTIRAAPRVCVGPVRYVGHDKVQRDIRNLKNAMAKAGAGYEGFLPSLTPVPAMPKRALQDRGRIQSRRRRGAMREEYKAILDAGLVLQIDFPRLISNWDVAQKSMSLADYRKQAAIFIEQLNHALRSLPEDRIRFHTCYGVKFSGRASAICSSKISSI